MPGAARNGAGLFVFPAGRCNFLSEYRKRLNSLRLDETRLLEAPTWSSRSFGTNSLKKPQLTNRPCGGTITIDPPGVRNNPGDEVGRQSPARPMTHRWNCENDGWEMATVDAHFRVSPVSR
jgi:hypothetical protein